ncbi:MAG: hypothetical protein F6K63_31320 [Moorea sp. SIO1G6]|nr:hypothetical protein [Moorena sp. SIO2B7]NET68645.1 hypothetical protein [Moorena sp. SIO1G6]
MRNPYKRLESMYTYRIAAPQLLLNAPQTTKNYYLYGIYFTQKIKADITWQSSELVKKFFFQIDKTFTKQIGTSVLLRDEDVKKLPLQESEHYDYALL